jgi:hypothetical protein
VAGRGTPQRRPALPLAGSRSRRKSPIAGSVGPGNAGRRNCGIGSGHKGYSGIVAMCLSFSTGSADRCSAHARSASQPQISEAATRQFPCWFCGHHSKPHSHRFSTRFVFTPYRSVKRNETLRVPGQRNAAKHNETRETHINQPIVKSRLLPFHCLGKLCETPRNARRPGSDPWCETPRNASPFPSYPRKPSRIGLCNPMVHNNLCNFLWCIRLFQLAGNVNRPAGHVPDGAEQVGSVSLAEETV